LDIFLKFFGNFSQRFFWGVNFLEEFFERNFLEGFLGGFFWEDFFGRNFLFHFDVEGIDFIVEILVFVKILSKSKEGRKEEEFRSLEVRLQVHRT
jgi:hypothetical protein